MKSVDLEWPALTAENIPESVRRDVEEKKARAKVEAEMMKEYKKTGEISLQKTEKKSSKK